MVSHRTSLRFDLTAPTSQQFLEIYQEVDRGDAKHMELVSYILELGFLYGVVRKP